MNTLTFKIALSMFGGLIFTFILGSSLTSVAYTQDDRPTPTPSTTPLPTLTLPDWVNDLEVNVLSLQIRNEAHGKGHNVLLNINTGEEFPIDLSYVDEVVWLETDEGIFLKLHRYQSSGRDNSDGFNEFVNIQTGELTRLPLGDIIAPRVMPTTRIVQDNGAGISFQIHTKTEIINASHGLYDVDTAVHIILLHSAQNVSKTIKTLHGDRGHNLAVRWVGGGRYLAISISYIIKEDDIFFLEENALVTEIDFYNTNGEWDATGTIIALGGLNSVQWSPGNNAYFIYRTKDWGTERICFVRQAEDRDRDCDWFYEWETAQNSKITQYTWSQDGTKIIVTYRNNDGLHGGLCLFDVETKAIDCPLEKQVTVGTFASTYTYQLPNKYGVFQYYNLAEDMSDEDSPRQTGICYLNQETYAVGCLADDLTPVESYYRATSLAPNGETLALIYQGYGVPTFDDGLCFFNFNTASATCPVTPDDISHKYIHRYSWSPDNNYFVFMYTRAGPYGDDVSDTEYGIVDIQAGSYRRGGYAKWEGDLSDHWRPAISK